MARPREALVRRNTIRLGIAQAALWAVLAIWVGTSPAHVVELTGHDYWSGIAVAIYSLSAAAGALFGGRAMDRVGRRPGLLGGYGLLLAASGVMGVSDRSVVGVLAATVALGVGAGVAHLGRGAVAEMYPPDSRARWVGVVLLAGTAGAIGGAPLVNAIASAVGESGHLAVWVSSAILAAAGLVCMVGLRPDPKDLAVDVMIEAPASERRTMGRMFRLPPLRAALSTVAVSQAAMTGIMGVSSVVIVHHHGSTRTASAVVVSLHLGAMFAFSPLIGLLLDRWGRRPGLLAGGVVSVAGAVLSAMAEGTFLFGAGLFLVGLGWSGTYLGATAVVSDVTARAERQGVLGVVDLVTHSASTVGALAGGFLLDTGGLSVVGMVMGAILVPALILVAALREASPGRWAGAGTA